MRASSLSFRSGVCGQTGQTCWMPNSLLNDSHSSKKIIHFFFCVLYPRVNENLNTHRVPVRNFPKCDNWVKVTFPPRKWRKESGDGAGNCSRALLVNDSLSASFGTARALGFRAGNRLRALTELLYRGENDPTIKNRRTMIGYVTTFSFSKTWISPMYVKKQMNEKIRKCKIKKNFQCSVKWKKSVYREF